MILPRPADAIHKTWLYRLLTGIADNAFLVSQLRFKGGTCAAMRGLINRFSVDLDFDLPDSGKMQEVNENLAMLFKELGLEIKDYSRKVPQFFLKYPAEGRRRNTLKLDMTLPPPKSNDYEPVRLNEIDRIIYCQTPETMFANKLVSVMDRYGKTRSVAGRDIYDIHTFFMKGIGYKAEIIKERTGMASAVYLRRLRAFIEKKVTQKVIDEDLNHLLPDKEFKKMRLGLKRETLVFLADAASNPEK